MGGGSTPVSDGGGGGGGTGNDSILSLLQKIYDFIVSLWDRGKSRSTIEVISLTTGATFQRLYTNSRLVRSAIIQNISTENVTLTTTPGGTAGLGIILNQGAGAGQAGGSLPTGNVDLMSYFFVRTTAGATLALHIEE